MLIELGNKLFSGLKNCSDRIRLFGGNTRLYLLTVLITEATMGVYRLLFIFLSSAWGMLKRSWGILSLRTRWQPWCSHCLWDILSIGLDCKRRRSRPVFL